ncbi:MAG: hypothetical protein WCV84_04010 [Patescibacteria group bacterium]
MFTISKTARYRVLFLTISLLLVAWVYSVNRTSPSAVATTRERVHAQRLWYGQPIPAQPSPSHMARYLLLSQQTMEGTRLDLPQLSHQPTRQVLAQSRDMILNRPTPANAWNWDGVRAVVRSMGAEIALLQTANPNALGGAFSYELVSRSFIVNVPPNDQSGSNTLDMSGAMVHEGTHALVEQEYLRLCGFTHEQWMRILLQCRDVRFEESYLSEILAHLNQEVYWGSLVNIQDLMALGYVRDTYEARHGSPYALARRLAEHARRDVGTHGDLCGPPVSIRGPRQGSFCLPSMIQDIPMVWDVMDARP